MATVALSQAQKLLKHKDEKIAPAGFESLSTSDTVDAEDTQGRETSTNPVVFAPPSRRSPIMRISISNLVGVFLSAALLAACSG
jgi:hypothetical protein